MSGDRGQAHGHVLAKRNGREFTHPPVSRARADTRHSREGVMWDSGYKRQAEVVL